jgi:hypothetical protein
LLSDVGSFSSLGNFAMEGEMSSLTGMVNAWYEIQTGTNWTPFVGNGLGAAHVSLEVDSIGTAASNFDESNTVFAY